MDRWWFKRVRLYFSGVLDKNKKNRKKKRIYKRRIFQHLFFINGHGRIWEGSSLPCRLSPPPISLPLQNWSFDMAESNGSHNESSSGNPLSFCFLNYLRGDLLNRLMTLRVFNLSFFNCKGLKPFYLFTEVCCLLVEFWISTISQTRQVLSLAFGTC